MACKQSSLVFGSFGEWRKPFVRPLCAVDLETIDRALSSQCNCIQLKVKVMKTRACSGYCPENDLEVG